MRNESFNRSVEAITHDSDPKYLRFTEFDRNLDPPAENLYTTGNLGEANNPDTAASGGSTGPVINSLTGGTLNNVALTVAPPVVIGDLTAGHVNVRIIDTEHNIYGPFPIDYVTLQASASLIDLNEWAIPSALLGWDLTPLIGHTVDTINFDAVGAITWVAPNLGSDSQIAVIYNESQLHPAVYPGFDMLSPDDEVATAIDAVPYSGLFYFNITLKLRGSPENNLAVTIPLDAATLIADNNAPTTQEGFTVIETPLSPYNTWLTVGFAVNLPSGYSSSGSPAINSSSVFFDLGINGGSGFFPLGNAPGGWAGVPTGFNPLNPSAFVPLQPFETTPLGLALTLRLRPEDVPAQLPLLLMTEMYELRHRNLPAFRFYFTPPGPSEADPLLNVQMLVSQGQVFEGQEWLWTPIPVDVLDGSGAVIAAFPAVLHPNQGPMTGFPLNYGGTMVIVPKEYTGPWNYIKLLLYTPDGQDVALLNGYAVDILANAREVI